MFEFKLPDLGEGIHEGEILKWHVMPGDEIKEDDPLVDIETDKAAVTIPSPKAGHVQAIGGKVGDVVAVGAVIAVIGDGLPVAAQEQEAPAPEHGAPEPPPALETLKCSIPAAPATRRLAREMNLNICEITPSGAGGRVTPEDVQAFAGNKPSSKKAAKPTEPVEPRIAEAEYAAHAASTIPFLDIEPLPDFSQWGPIEKEQLRSIRRKVAHKMVTSKILIPHVVHMDEADVTLLEEFRHKELEQLKDKAPHLTLLSFVIKAVVAGLKASPAFNASVDPFNEELIYKKYYNIGIAVDTGRGLIVPVVKNADSKSIIQIAKEINDLATRARDSKIEVSELQGGTFTITNIGPIGGTFFTPAINYPETAILGMGRSQDKPVVRDSNIVIRKMLPLSLAFDHRIADGADAARFVTEMISKLSDPNLLLLET